MRSRADLWIALTLLVATFAVYAPVRSFEFINYDDPEYVTRNLTVRAGLSAHGAAWAFAPHAANWFPVTWVSHMLDCQIFGLQSGWHHLINVLLHAVAAWLLFACLTRATGSRWPAAFVAFVFALHPLHVESVAWVAERKDVLSACFWFLALWFYVMYAERPSGERYFLVVAAFCLGIMSKPMIVTLPLVLLLIDVWPLRRKPALVEKVPLFAISAVAALVTFFVQKGAGAVKAVPFGTRLENALVSLVIYIAKMFWPAKLAVFYPYPRSIPVWQTALAALLVAAITVAVIRVFRTRPYLTVGWLWFIVTILPVLGLVQVGEQARADRYMYVPMIGLAIMLAWGGVDVIRRWPQTRTTLIGLGAAACVACAVLASMQIQYWRNSETLFQHALEVTQRNYVAEHNLGDYLLGVPARVDDAVPHLEAAISIKPQSAEAHTDLASAYTMIPGRLTDAIREYRAALAIAPDSAIPHNDLGNALSQLPDGLPQAIAEYEAALRIKPDYAEAENNLGSALAKTGHTQHAIGHFEAALKIDPDYAQARKNLDLAQSHAPSDSAEAHYGLGLQLAKAGRSDEAVAQLETALRLKPDYAEAHNNLGVVLSQMPRRLPDAITHFEAALRMRPDYGDAHFNLGMALANAGRFPDAIQHLEAAERIKPDPEIERMLEQVRTASRAGRTH